MNDIVNQIQLIRLNVLPPYTYDDDEGQRSDEDYIEFYRAHIDDAIAAADLYVHQYRRFAETPESDEPFAGYLIARRRFVHTLPFCQDEYPDELSMDYDSTCDSLRSFYCQEGRASTVARDLESLARFQSLLRRFRAATL